MKPAAALAITAAALLLIASRRDAVGVVEAGEGDALGQLAAFQPAALLDTGESWFYRLTEEAATVDTDTAARNVRAFLSVLQQAEGTAGRGDPYRICYGYRHTIRDLRDHPAITGEWSGEVLPPAMCANAGFGPGCRSTAAGAYQIIRPTWAGLKGDLRLPDFSPASQDAAAVELIRRRGALEAVKAGRFAEAVNRCRNEWASLPGNYAGQGQRTLTQLAGWFSNAGGSLA